MDVWKIIYFQNDDEKPLAPLGIFAEFLFKN